MDRVLDARDALSAKAGLKLSLMFENVLLKFFTRETSFPQFNSQLSSQNKETTVPPKRTFYNPSSPKMTDGIVIHPLGFHLLLRAVIEMRDQGSDALLRF